MTRLTVPERLNERVQVMGVLNRTPDSFYDGGACADERAARARLEQILAEGADIVDIGGESSRPGAPPVAAREQIARIGGLIEMAVAAGAFVSVDTMSPEVAEVALGLGAQMINSVGLEPASSLGAIAARHDAQLVLTHCRGPMSEMAGFSRYDPAAYGDVVADVAREWRAAAERAVAAGLAWDRLVFDPGLGFTKTAEQSLELCARLDQFRSLEVPMLVGTSRKSYLGVVVGRELATAPPSPADRLGASIAAAVAAVAAGADIVRVHDVAATRQAIAYARVLERERCGSRTGQPPTPPVPLAVGGDAERSAPSREPGGSNEGQPQPSIGGGAGA